MKLPGFASVACVLSLITTAGCGDNHPGDEATGALVGVTAVSTVGVLLDELPAATRDRAATELLARPAQFWLDQAHAQLRLTGLRLVYRALYYDEAEGKGSLPLPPEEVWTVTLTDTPRRARIDGHDLVTVGYRLDTTLLSDLESPAQSEPALGQAGGLWDERFVLPVDPTLLLQRTGFACMDEDQFPTDSVDTENAYEFYDDICDVETPATASCHVTELPNESCVAAVRRAIGRTSTTVRFKRLAWDSALADKVRFGEVTTVDAPDLKVVVEGTQSLSNHRVIYKYIPADNCAVVEGCVTGTGWRRLLTFDSIDQNVGGEPLHIGRVDYFHEGDLGYELIDHGVYELSACHGHYHFLHYGDFSFSAAGSSSTNKNGFCLESTDRLSNNEHATLRKTYDCATQGVDPGWVDLYAAGLTCNWIDLTDVDTSAGDLTGQLEFHSNPDGFMCEGELLADAAGEQAWESTSFTTDDGAPVDRPACTQSPSAAGNDDGQVDAVVRSDGGALREPCADEHLLGSRRQCGFTAQAPIVCGPGTTVTLACTGGDAAHPQAVRVCESSTVLGGGVDCTFATALGTAELTTGTGTVTFGCPDARDATELGGQVALYTAPLYPPDGAATVTCVPQI